MVEDKQTNKVMGESGDSYTESQSKTIASTIAKKEKKINCVQSFYKNCYF